MEIPLALTEHQLECILFAMKRELDNSIERGEKEAFDFFMDIYLKAWACIPVDNLVKTSEFWDKKYNPQIIKFR